MKLSNMKFKASVASLIIKFEFILVCNQFLMASNWPMFFSPTLLDWSLDYTMLSGILWVGVLPRSMGGAFKPKINHSSAGPSDYIKSPLEWVSKKPAGKI